MTQPDGTITEKQVFIKAVGAAISAVTVETIFFLLALFVGYVWHFGGFLLAWVAVVAAAIDLLCVFLLVVLGYVVTIGIMVWVRICNRRLRTRYHPDIYTTGQVIVRAGATGICCLYAYLLYRIWIVYPT
jgi:hypothetical protein